MSVAVAATTLVAPVVVVAVVAAQSVKLPLLFPTPFVHSIMGRANAHSTLVRRGRVLDVSITRSMGPSSADSVREKADASFFDELESFLNDSAILGEDTVLGEGEQAYEDERISSVALADLDTSQIGDAVAAFTEHMEVAEKSNEELEVALAHVSAVSA